jgi:hypothetical protein
VLRGTTVYNVTGWHLLDIRPGAGVSVPLPDGQARSRDAG